MCDPGSIALAATVASAVVGAGGALYAGKAAQQQGAYEAKIADRNAHLADQQAQDANERGFKEARDYQRKVAQIKGQQQAAQAANGIDTDFGSALQTQEDTAMIAAEDARTIYGNTENEVKGFEINAFNYQAQGRAAKAKGNAAMTAGIFGAASSLLGGATQFGKIKAGQGG